MNENYYIGKNVKTLREKFGLGSSSFISPLDLLKNYDGEDAPYENVEHLIPKTETSSSSTTNDVELTESNYTKYTFKSNKNATNPIAKSKEQPDLFPTSS